VIKAFLILRRLFFGEFMKSLMLVAVSFLSLSTFADCTQLDAQYIGTVVEHSKVRVDQNVFECQYKISYSQFNSSYICPLDIDEVSSFKFEDKNCALKNGDFVSGYMHRNLDSDEIVLE
jgi:hypothetical protein